MKLINCTPHDITISTPTGDVVIVASGQLARVGVITKDSVESYGTIATALGITIVVRQSGEVEGLPTKPMSTEVAPCLVSGMVLDALAGRKDLVGVVFAPDTSMEASILNVKGQVIATTRLATVNA